MSLHWPCLHSIHHAASDTAPVDFTLQFERDSFESRDGKQLFISTSYPLATTIESAPPSALNIWLQNPWVANWLITIFLLVVEFELVTCQRGKHLTLSMEESDIIKIEEDDDDNVFAKGRSDRVQDQLTPRNSL